MGWYIVEKKKMSDIQKTLGRIHSIESFGTVDGPGIRFVVFLQGCPMRCQYCHNPDTWKTEGGTLRSVEDILKEYDGYREFLRGGGLTVTGGEPLMQMEFVLALFTAAKARGIHTCLDTSGVLFPGEFWKAKSNETKDIFQNKDSEQAKLLEAYYELTKVTDLVMLDIKHVDDTIHKKLTGCSNKNILAFAEFLNCSNATLWIRHVVVPGITDQKEQLHQLGYYLGGLRKLKGLDILPYHTMGEVKYQKLGMVYPLAGVRALEKKEALAAREEVLAGMKERLREVKKS